VIGRRCGDAGSILGLVFLLGYRILVLVLGDGLLRCRWLVVGWSMGFSFDLIELGWLGAAALDDLIVYLAKHSVGRHSKPLGALVS